MATIEQFAKRIRYYLSAEPFQGRTTRNLDQEFIYWVQCTATGRIKIGKSCTPYQRISGLQTGCPSKLTILAVFEAPFPLESELHIWLDDYLVHGEWFKESKSVVNCLLAMADTCRLAPKHKTIREGTLLALSRARKEARLASRLQQVSFQPNPSSP